MSKEAAAEALKAAWAPRRRGKASAKQAADVGQSRAQPTGPKGDVGGGETPRKVQRPVEGVGEEDVGESKMTPKARLFALEYRLDLNGKQAAIRAGYSENGAEVQASRLLRNVHVRAIVETAQSKAEAKLGITADRILEELARIAFLDPKELRDPATGEMRPFHELSADVVRALSVETEEYSENTADGVKVGRKTKIKPHDKLKALELLGKYKRLFGDREESTGNTTNNIVVMDPKNAQAMQAALAIWSGMTAPRLAESRTEVIDVESKPVAETLLPPKDVGR